MTRDEIINLASQAIEETHSKVSLPIPFVMRFAVLVAAAERAKQERKDLVAYLTADKNMLVFADKCVDMQHLMTPLYAFQPVTAPVRLTDEQADTIWREIQDTSITSPEYPHRRFKDKIEAASLRANGFDIQPAEGN